MQRFPTNPELDEPPFFPPSLCGVCVCGRVCEFARVLAYVLFTRAQHMPPKNTKQKTSLSGCQYINDGCHI